MGDSSEEFTFTKQQYDNIISDIETLKDRNNRIIMNMVSNSSISDSMPGVGMLKAAGKKLFGIASDKLLKTFSTNSTGTSDNMANSRDVTPKFFEVDPFLVPDHMKGYTNDALYNTNGKRVQEEKGPILPSLLPNFRKMLGRVNDNGGGAKRRRKSSYRKSYRKSRKNRRTRRR
jgi:hypothetical protein